MIVLKTTLERDKRSTRNSKGVDNKKRTSSQNGRTVDGTLARLVIGRLSEGRRMSHETRGEEKKGGPICLLFSEAGRWYLYGAESNARE